jgi:hypothetical protein
MAVGSPFGDTARLEPWYSSVVEVILRMLLNKPGEENLISEQSVAAGNRFCVGVPCYIRSRWIFEIQKIELQTVVSREQARKGPASLGLAHTASKRVRSIQQYRYYTAYSHN